jgi:hypothetical protein
VVDTGGGGTASQAARLRAVLAAPASRGAVDWLEARLG